MTIALSLVFIPTVVLLSARVLGTGVSLPIVLGSILLVTIAGFLAYRFWREAPACPREPQLEIAPLAAASLLPIIFACLLLTVVAFGGFGEIRAALPTALLMVAAAAIQMFCDWRRARSDLVLEAKPRGKFSESGLKSGAFQRFAVIPGWRILLQGTTRWHRALLPLVLLAVLVRGYLGPILHDWPYIRGADQYVHAVMVNLVVSKGSAQSFSLYPPGFHVLSAVLSHLTGLEPLDLYPYIAPALLLLPALSVYLLAGRIFGRAYSLVSALFAGALVSSPQRFLNDGTYVELIAAQFLLVLTLGAVVTFLQSPHMRSAVLIGLLGSSVVFYHSVSTIYLLGVLGLIAALVFPYLVLRERHAFRLLAGAMALLGTLSFVYAWETYDLFNTFLGLVQRNATTESLQQAVRTVGTEPGPQLSMLPQYLSQPVVHLGLLGALLLPIRLRAMCAKSRIVVGMLLGWALLYLVGSLTSLSGVPWRFARDLGIPMSILAAVAFVTILRSFRTLNPIVSMAVLGVSLVVALQLNQNLVAATQPTRFRLMTPELREAGEWLRDHNEGGNVITSPMINQMMLALGGYEQLPAVTQKQLDDPRGILRKHRPILADVRWVYDHAKGGRTRQVLEKYDVRYLVLVKRFPKYYPSREDARVRYGRFVSQPTLYEVVFENEQVIVFKVLR